MFKTFRTGVGKNGGPTGLGLRICGLDFYKISGSARFSGPGFRLVWEIGRPTGLGLRICGLDFFEISGSARFFKDIYKDIKI